MEGRRVLGRTKITCFHFLSVILMKTLSELKVFI